MSIAKFNKWQSVDGVTRNAVLQVVSKEVTTTSSTTSTSFGDVTDMFLAITPTSATSKILVMFTPFIFITRSSNANYMDLQILRDSTIVFRPGYNAGSGNQAFGFAAVGTTSINIMFVAPLCFLDSPSTTSEIVYKLQSSVFTSANSGSSTVNLGGGKSTITLMEIAQ